MSTENTTTKLPDPEVPLHVVKSVEKQWVARCSALGYTTKAKRLKNQAEFFVGAMSTMVALGAPVCAYWTICICSGRTIGFENE